MAKYAVELNRTASSSAALGSVTSDGTTPRRGKIYDLIFGSEATPADAAILWTVQRCTAAGTSTGVTPEPLDPADAACLSDAGENHTIEPTFTANKVVLSIALNQRATFRWVAAPGGELIYPATAANGFGIQTDTISSGTPVISATVHFEEQ